MLNNKNYLKHILTMVLLIWSGYTGTGYANFFPVRLYQKQIKNRPREIFPALFL